MRARLIATAALAVPALAFVSATPAADAAPAAADCTPTITMDAPFQDVGGTVIFPAHYNLCVTSKVTVKFRDRDSGGWGGGASTTSAGPGSTWSGVCSPGGLEHRWVAYATIKTPTGGTLLAKTAKVYFKSAPVKRNCTEYVPAG